MYIRSLFYRKKFYKGSVYNLFEEYGNLMQFIAFVVSIEIHMLWHLNRYEDNEHPGMYGKAYTA